jgi:hypothetical protein
MDGIILGAGINDCNFNINGRCTNQIITRNILQSGFSRDWDSKQNCVYTQIGVLLCSCYLQESAAEGYGSRRYSLQQPQLETALH